MMLEALPRSAYYSAGIVIVVLFVLYNRISSSSRKGILLPPGPPARWFWSNALPAVK
jgi:hypothetical protein